MFVLVGPRGWVLGLTSGAGEIAHPRPWPGGRSRERRQCRAARAGQSGAGRSERRPCSHTLTGRLRQMARSLTVSRPAVGRASELDCRSPLGLEEQGPRSRGAEVRRSPHPCPSLLSAPHLQVSPVPRRSRPCRRIHAVLAPGQPCPLGGQSTKGSVQQPCLPGEL